MPYVMNKPYPTPGNLLPMPSSLSEVLKEPNIKLGQKRKLLDSEGGRYSVHVLYT